MCITEAGPLTSINLPQSAPMWYTVKSLCVSFFRTDWPVSLDPFSGPGKGTAEISDWWNIDTAMSAADFKGVTTALACSRLAQRLDWSFYKTLTLSRTQSLLTSWSDVTRARSRSSYCVHWQYTPRCRKTGWPRMKVYPITHLRHAPQTHVTCVQREPQGVVRPYITGNVNFTTCHPVTGETAVHWRQFFFYRHCLLSSSASSPFSLWILCHKK